MGYGLNHETFEYECASYFCLGQILKRRLVLTPLVENCGDAVYGFHGSSGKDVPFLFPGAPWLFLEILRGISRRMVVKTGSGMFTKQQTIHSSHDTRQSWELVLTKDYIE
jgi:hypothetical protein